MADYYQAWRGPPEVEYYPNVNVPPALVERLDRKTSRVQPGVVKPAIESILAAPGFATYDVYDVDVYSYPWPYLWAIYDARANKSFFVVATDSGNIAYRIARRKRPDGKYLALPENYERHILRQAIEKTGEKPLLLVAWKSQGRGPLFGRTAGNATVYFAYGFGKYGKGKAKKTW